MIGIHGGCPAGSYLEKIGDLDSCPLGSRHLIHPNHPNCYKDICPLGRLAA
jgi:hypothetical protein